MTGATTTARSQFFLTNRVANPVLRRLLRTRAGRLGRHLAVLRYRGRRSGLPHELIVQYALEGSAVWIAVGWPERKTWWRNLRTPAPVELWFAGERHSATAVVVDGAADPTQAATGLTAYRARMGGTPASRTAAERTVLVRAQLTS